MNESKCPVPRDQQPTNEFIELSKSKIFSWPKTKKSLILILIKFWLGAFVLFLVISSGSVYFKTSLLKYILLSFFSSLSIPLLISIRYNLIEIKRGIDKLQKKLNKIYFKVDVLKYTLPEEIIRNRTKAPTQNFINI